MAMITIGLIDDNDNEVDDIQATIYTIFAKKQDISLPINFKQYILKATAEFKEELEEELLQDIDNQSIQSLIVDYKLDSLRQVISGKEIVEFLHEQVPAFPVVTLTNAPESSKQEIEIDPDKVYDKRDFFKVDGAEADDMVYKIYLNLSRYKTRRTALESELDEALKKFTSSEGTEVNASLLAHISELEDTLSDYTTTVDQTAAEKVLNVNELKDIVKELAELEKAMLRD